MVENSSKSKDILKKIEDIMKCEICKNKYDYNVHRPLIIKCGHTFCKNCIYNPRQISLNRNNNSKSKSFFICPLDNITHSFTLDKNINILEPTIYPNLKLELILKEIMNINEPIIKEKYIVYSKPDMKRNKSPEISNKNLMNIREEIAKKEKKGKNENINIKINSGNQIINVNAINVNIDTGKKNENNVDEKINKENNDSMLNDDLNNLQINEEMNINDKKLNFENDKINDDSIETIPYEEKSMTNMSFRDDFKELLNKNDELKYQMTNNLNLKTDENNNDIFSNNGIKKKVINNNIKGKQEMKTYNKKMLIQQSNSSNKNNNKIAIDLSRKKFNDIKEKDNEVDKLKNSIYKNKIIKDLNTNLKNNTSKKDSLNSKEYINKDEKNNSSNNYYIKNLKNFVFDKNNKNNINILNSKDNISKNLNFDYLIKFATKSETKDFLRKTNYHELSDRKIIQNMKTIGSNNSSSRPNVINVQSIKRESDKKNNLNYSLDNNSSEGEKYNKNYRKNRTVFRKKKKINYENENSDNNIINKLEENYKHENNQSLADLAEKAKTNQLNQYIFDNSPNVYNKKSLIPKNNYAAAKNTISNSMNKSNSSQNNNNLNINNVTKGRKLDFDNINYDEIINSGLYNSNNSNSKRIILSSIQKFKTINNSNSNININNINITSNKGNSINSNNNSIGNVNNSNNSNNNLNLEQNMMINSSYKKKSPINIIYNNKNDEPDTPKIKAANNQNIISIYIKMNNKNKNLDSNKKSGNKLEIDKNKINLSNNSNILDNKKNNSNLGNNINNNDYIEERKYPKTLRETSNNYSSQKSMKNSPESYIQSLTDQFESLLRKENILINTEKYDKYKNYFSKMIISPYLPKIISENPNSEIKITFLNKGDDLFIGFLEKNSRQFQTPNPKCGILFNKKGEYYEGSFVNGQKEGEGKIIYKNGTIYEGSLKHNRHHGFGKLTQLDGEIFIGEWKEGKIHGNGKRYHSNGDKYIGSYINNIRNGQGHYTFANGDSYEGNWSNGKANGNGKFMFKNGNIYEGEFKDNIISGKGTYTTKNGDIYMGNFINGLINGKGTLIYKNGNKYTGEFKNGKKDGEGIIYDKDGKIISSGIWIQDKFMN